MWVSLTLCSHSVTPDQKWVLAPSGSCRSVLSLHLPETITFLLPFFSAHSNSGTGFVFCSIHSTLPLLPPLLFALMSPMGVLVWQKSRNSCSKVDTWALNGQTELVKCKISGPHCSLRRNGISHLSTKGLFFYLVIGFFIRIPKLHFSYVALRSHSHIYPRQAKTAVSICFFKISETTSDIQTNYRGRRVYLPTFLFRREF